MGQLLAGELPGELPGVAGSCREERRRREEGAGSGPEHHAREDGEREPLRQQLGEAIGDA